MYEAIESFSGIISMAQGEVREIPDETLAKDLIKSKFIKKYVPDNAKAIKEELDKANKTIEDLTNENLELKEEIETLKAQLPTAEGEKTPDKENNESDDENKDDDNNESSENAKEKDKK